MGSKGGNEGGEDFAPEAGENTDLQRDARELARAKASDKGSAYLQYL